MTKMTSRATGAEMTQATVSAALRRTLGRFTPGTHRDTKVAGLLLRVGSRKATWVYSYIPRGVREDGLRHGRRELRLGDAATGDASTTMTLVDARQAAAEAKIAVAAGKDPFGERKAQAAVLVAARATKATTLDGALESYETDLMARSRPKEASRWQAIHYAKRAIALMAVGGLPVTALDGERVRQFVRAPVLIERKGKKAEASSSEKRHLWVGLCAFITYLVERGWLDTDPTVAVARRERPAAGASRDHVPSVAELRGVWKAVDGEKDAVRDLVRFLLLVPLRRDEAAGLLWSEVDLAGGWIRIGAQRMKAGEQHELPLAGEAKAILERRAAEVEKRREMRKTGKPAKADELVFPGPTAGEVFSGWGRLMARVRRALGQEDQARANRFTLHDIRRSFVSTLADRFDENLLDLMLAHRPSSRRGSSAAYQKAKRLPERAAVMTAWSNLVVGQAASTVVPFKTSA
jgi:integrase